MFGVGGVEQVLQGVSGGRRSPVAGEDLETDFGGGGRLGAALEIADIDESFEAEGHDFNEHQLGAMLKLRFRGVFKRF